MRRPERVVSMATYEIWLEELAVKTSGWTVAAISDLPRVPGRQDIEWRPLQHALRLSAFGANVFVALVSGDELIGPHDESGEHGQEEIYLILEGSLRFELDGEILDVSRNEMVAVRDRGVRRRATALESGSVVLVVGAPPGNLRRSTWRPEWFAGVPRIGDGDQREQFGR
jgi:mannose-6-phosphate isomerase-like protein (cupin superfamily)